MINFIEKMIPNPLKEQEETIAKLTERVFELEKVVSEISKIVLVHQGAIESMIQVQNIITTEMNALFGGPPSLKKEELN